MMVEALNTKDLTSASVAYTMQKVIQKRKADLINYLENVNLNKCGR